MVQIPGLDEDLERALIAATQGKAQSEVVVGYGVIGKLVDETLQGADRAVLVSRVEVSIGRHPWADERTLVAPVASQLRLVCWVEPGRDCD